MRILYIEDSTDNHFLIGFYIKGLPIKLECIETTDQALSTLEKEAFDLVLLDWNLPGSISSLDLLHQLRSNELSQNTPVWVISAMQNHEILPKIKGISNVLFLRKPVRKAEFLDLLKTHFSSLLTSL